MSQSSRRKLKIQAVVLNAASSHHRLLVRFDGLVGVGGLSRQARIDASVRGLLLRWTDPQPAVQHREDDPVHNENPVQDVTHIHVSDGLGRRAAVRRRVWLFPAVKTVELRAAANRK